MFRLNCHPGDRVPRPPRFRLSGVRQDSGLGAGAQVPHAHPHRGRPLQVLLLLVAGEHEVLAQEAQAQVAQAVATHRRGKHAGRQDGQYGLSSAASGHWRLVFVIV